MNSPDDIPPQYVAAVKRMVQALQRATLRGRKPRFRLPAPDIMFVAPLDAVLDRICANDDAKQLCQVLLHVTNGEATCSMLTSALLMVKVDYEVVDPSYFGQVRVISRGGGV